MFFKKLGFFTDVVVYSNCNYATETVSNTDQTKMVGGRSIKEITMPYRLFYKVFSSLSKKLNKPQTIDNPPNYKPNVEEEKPTVSKPTKLNGFFDFVDSFTKTNKPKKEKDLTNTIDNTIESIKQNVIDYVQPKPDEPPKENSFMKQIYDFDSSIGKVKDNIVDTVSEITTPKDEIDNPNNIVSKQTNDIEETKPPNEENSIVNKTINALNSTFDNIKSKVVDYTDTHAQPAETPVEPPAEPPIEPQFESPQLEPPAEPPIESPQVESPPSEPPSTEPPVESHVEPPVESPPIEPPTESPTEPPKEKSILSSIVNTIDNKIEDIKNTVANYAENTKLQEEPQKQLVEIPYLLKQTLTQDTVENQTNKPVIHIKIFGKSIQQVSQKTEYSHYVDEYLLKREIDIISSGKKQIADTQFCQQYIIDGVYLIIGPIENKTVDNSQDPKQKWSIIKNTDVYKKFVRYNIT
jgi:hypothetical protein